MIVSSFISSFVKQIPKMITSMAVQTTNKYFICGWKISGIGLTSSTAKIDSKNDSSKCFSKSLWFPYLIIGQNKPNHVLFDISK